MRVIVVLEGLLASAAVMLAVSSCGTAPAYAHEWFTGTRDPMTNWGCCNDKDCAEVEDTDVRQIDGGYVYLPTNEFIPHERVQSSKTWKFARCVQMWDGEFGKVKFPKGSTRCFFAPSGV